MHIWTYISSKDQKNHKGIRYYIEVYSVIIITKISKSSAGQHCSAYATRSCSAAAEPKHAETLNLLDNFLISEIYTYFGPGNNAVMSSILCILPALLILLVKEYPRKLLCKWPPINPGF